jgi:Reverse transcriptase (RNA-dependent DNA polymerase)
MGATKSFESYFSPAEIIRTLCRLRIAQARKRHDNQFFYNISTHAKRPSATSELDKYFPPRRQWLRLRKSERKKRGSIKIYQHALERTVLALMRDSRHALAPWLVELNQLIAELRYFALMNPSYGMSQPQMAFVKKPKGNEYRSIANYGLRDQIVGGLCAKYLRVVFDQDFSDSAFAFRVAGNNSKVPTHHDAVEQLLKMRRRFQDQPLWVAECDIRGFYDSVHHDKARAAFMLACERAAERKITVDSRAIVIFEAYLASYSFNGVARREFNEIRERKYPNGILKWPEDALKQIWPNLESEPIGVPQGGALSCLIANLVLDHCDRAVLSEGTYDLFYARYCDDMIIASPHQELCKEAFTRYIVALKGVALPKHDVKTIDSYTKQVWNDKSKGPYRWTKPICKGDVPWVGFVGYQVRYDGLMRIRPDSLRKELQKQVEVAGSLLRSLRQRKGKNRKEDVLLHKHGIRRTKGQIIFRLRQRLIAMSVGRRFLNSVTGKLSEQCWTAGFEQLNERPFVLSQLKKLDRGRERQISRVIKAVRTLKVDAEGRPLGNEPKYWGRPFSYAGQFMRIVVSRSVPAKTTPPVDSIVPTAKMEETVLNPPAKEPEARATDSVQLRIVDEESSE